MSIGSDNIGPNYIAPIPAGSRHPGIGISNPGIEKSTPGLQSLDGVVNASTFSADHLAGYSTTHLKSLKPAKIIDFQVTTKMLRLFTQYCVGSDNIMWSSRWQPHLKCWFCLARRYLIRFGVGTVSWVWVTWTHFFAINLSILNRSASNLVSMRKPTGPACWQISGVLKPAFGEIWKVKCFSSTPPTRNPGILPVRRWRNYKGYVNILQSSKYYQNLSREFWGGRVRTLHYLKLNISPAGGHRPPNCFCLPKSAMP